jgi:hypothetical protein
MDITQYKRKELHRFNYRKFELWKLTVEELRAMRLQGAMPLMLFARDGKRAEVVEEVVSELLGSANKDMLALTYALASLIFKERIDSDWLRRRFLMMNDLIKESWAYQEMTQESREEGWREGLQEGLLIAR